KIGRYLRNSKLNELPQLWNVLIGQMSFVGPRPEDYKIAMTWPPEVRKEISSVRPGITSPASIIYRDEEHLLKGDDFMDNYLGKILPDKQRLDQLYVRNHNLFVDMDVLAATIIMLLPQIRGKEIDEQVLFGGPTLMLFRRVVPWFLIDIIVATISVGLSGIVWRISAVINLGIPVFFILAVAIALIISLINMILGLQKISWREASPAYVIDIGISVGLTMFIYGWSIDFGSPNPGSLSACSG
ncbi:MAG: sugar transferase, partial [Chloroflexi bacterium]|nr:sugar transferase [Chloroflexota bacterium]